MIHLTEKPVELAARALTYSSQSGENVLDLFGGSGSTLIAAQQTGRHAYLMELDPLYCDGIVQRFEAFTGTKAERMRAAIALLDYALRGVNAADTLHSEPQTVTTTPMDTGEVVHLLAARLRELDAAELPTGEKARLTATLADALLRAIGVHLLDQRQEVLQAVLLSRKGKG